MLLGGAMKENKCGACHAWGYNPSLTNGKCDVCERSEFQIQKDHGFINLKRSEAIELRTEFQGDDFDETDLPLR